MDDEEHVIPQSVVLSDVSVEATKLQLLKLEALFVTDEAVVGTVIPHVFIGFTHGSKSVDNDTKQNVHEHNFDS